MRTNREILEALTERLSVLSRDIIEAKSLGYSKDVENLKLNYKVTEGQIEARKAIQNNMYYLAIRANGVRWSDCIQVEIIADNHSEAADIAKDYSLLWNAEIRMSTSKGYNNQGYYFNKGYSC